MDLLRPVIRPYPWGTRTAIAALQGRPVPAPDPEAELWMGAHPSAPSALHRPPAPSTLHRPPAPSTPSVTLDAVIAGDPERELGAVCAARFGGRLPFLLKVLSAEKALSIQVHPSREQAEAGYAAENARGLAADDPARNYVDDWPKPELLYALTPFEVAAGLRTPADASGLLRALEVDELEPLAAALADAVGEDALGAALACVLEWPEPRPLVASVVAACQRLAASDSPFADACAAAVRVAADHPGDVGVVALLLMRHEVLQPGQAVFMPAGGLHAYLHGTGIELLANSDNVVRSGLTGKHIDVPELLRLLDPAVAVPLLSPRPLADGLATFDTPAEEFRLYLLDVAASLPLPGAGPSILLCLDGTCTLRAASGQELDLTRGDSCFIPFADGPLHATGPARLVQATPGTPPPGTPTPGTPTP
ncbi:MAG: mannose-6-phosphate isomerase, class I [Streptosporangiaceae bacterium]